MNKEEIENYISELESMFELSELEEHSRNILKVGIYIKQLQQENQELKKQIEYLHKSIERKEETIIDLQNERVPYTNEYVEELKKQLEEANEKILLLQASEPMN